MKFTWKIEQVRAKRKERKSRFNKSLHEDGKRQVKETAAIIAEAEASLIAMGTDRACLESALESAPETFLTAPKYLVMPETPEVMHEMHERQCQHSNLFAPEMLSPEATRCPDAADSEDVALEPVTSLSCLVQ